MNEVAQLEERLDAALGALSAGGDPAETDALQTRIAELEKALKKAEKRAQKAAEALAATQAELESLQEEYREEDAADDADIAALDRQIASLGQAQQDAFEEMRKSKQYAQHIRKLNAKLRKANAQNVGDANLINASLEADIEAMKSQREADLAELNGIIARLTPLVEGSSNG